MSLFRREALEHRAHRLHGEISLVLPVGWHVLGLTLIAVVLAALLFIIFAPYSRVQVVSGAIVPDKGVAPIVATRPGIVLAVRAREGQTIRAGTPLIEIATDESLASGRTVEEDVLEAVQRQDVALAWQSAHLTNAALAEQASLAAQSRGLQKELHSLDQQISVQRALVASAAKEMDLIQDVLRAGYITRRELLAREETLLTRRQRLAELNGIRAAKLTSLAETRRATERIREEASAQTAQLGAMRAELDQRRVAAHAREGYILTAPTDGRATAITVRLGQPVDSQQALMRIVPSNAQPRAELYVPTHSAGFLAEGQEVRLAIDAYPYQRFGTVSARVTAISTATIKHDGTSGAVYLVTAEMKQPWVMAFGRRQPLLPGMTLSARIITERQSLLQWLFQPVLAVRNR